jgi:hypothetical protein
LAGLKGAFEALKEVPRAYKEAVEAQDKINVNDGRSFAERQIDRLGKTLAARQEVTKTKRQELAQGTGKEVGPRATARLLGRQIVDSVMRGAYEKAVEYNAAVVEARVEHLPRGTEKTQQVIREAVPVENQDNGTSHIVSMPNGEASTGAIYNIVPPAPAPTEADLRTAAEDTARKEQKAALIEARNSALRNIVHAETNDDAKVISDQAYNDIFAMPGDDETRIAMINAIVTTYAKRVASPEIYEFVRQSARGDFVQNESALAEVPKAESVDSQSGESSHEQNSSVDRTVAIEAAKAVEKKKEGQLARMQRVALGMSQKAMNDHFFTKASNGEAQEQPAAVDTEAQATQPHVPSHETPAGDTKEDPFALARAAGVLRENSDLGEPVVTSYDEATHHSEDEPEKLAEVIDLLSVVAGAEQPPADDEAPTEELETVAEAINTQEDAPLSRDEMRQMEQTARSKIQLGEYDLWAEITKADANGVEVDIDGLIKNTRTAIQLNMQEWLQKEYQQHQASGLYLSTLEARTMESADSALESIKQAYLKTKQARENRQNGAA